MKRNPTPRKPTKPKPSAIDKFIALPNTDKQRIVDELDAQTPSQILARSRPLNASERRQWQRFKSKIGRPRIGKGAKTISLTVERDLLAQADRYAKQHGLSRAKLFAQALQSLLRPAA